ncbi:MAG: hypothetical protein CMF69_10530 [Magnetovibrio sp.]|nr:hypothetical protein [Magnetovibrio sp.]|tara:strand:- start:167 stop:793 length:627 start_codon:yes stop_codon:yes gene_type:complete
MSDINYGVITLADCEPSYRDTAFNFMATFARDLKDQAGVKIVRYGYFGTGSDAGALVFTQLYQDLNGFDEAQAVYAGSEAYQSLIRSGKVNVILRNIVKIIPIEFNACTELSPKYMVFTKAAMDPVNRDAAINHLSQVAHIFSDNGALTLRYGQLITGSNVGQYLVAATYPSLEAIEKTYDVLNENLVFRNLVTIANVNRREIVRLIS